MFPCVLNHGEVMEAEIRIIRPSLWSLNLKRAALVENGALVNIHTLRRSLSPNYC